MVRLQSLDDAVVGMELVSDHAPNAPFRILERLAYEPQIQTLHLRVYDMAQEAELKWSWRMKNYSLYEVLTPVCGDGLW